MSKLKGRITLVDKSTQWAIVSRSLLHWFYHCLATILLLAVLQALLGGVSKPWREHVQQLWPVAVSAFLALLILLPAIILDSLKLSTRVVGPIVRVRRALREIAAGEPYVPIEFPKEDFWPELAQELNAAVEVLANQHQTVEVELEASAR